MKFSLLTKVSALTFLLFSLSGWRAANQSLTPEELSSYFTDRLPYGHIQGINENGPCLVISMLSIGRDTYSIQSGKIEILDGYNPITGEALDALGIEFAFDSFNTNLHGEVTRKRFVLSSDEGEIVVLKGPDLRKLQITVSRDEKEITCQITAAAN